ncbi:peptidoglycan DD-metalloendopeptidase family protein [Paenibacillus sp. NPDC056579]|uniref:M23 family metallopeptidase n=1 Tax=unclassified Paenibacillus TaxID=185978 RepID=UPI001EF8966D|nr:M23 family metallopeptidase [Paenibacillus sp. H1-7]
MSTKDNIRQRRLERLRALKESAERPPFPLPEHSRPPHGYPLDERRRADADESVRWEDPEYVWKQKWNREMTLHDDRYGDLRYGGSGQRPGMNRLRTKLIVSCFLFAAVWGLFQWDHPLANKGKAYISSALNDSFQFQSVALWYEQRFGGSPSLLPALNTLYQEEAQKVDVVSKHYFAPVKGKIIAPYEASRLGVTVETSSDTPVAAMDTGLVVYVGNKEDTGYTIIIRHTNGLQSVYGWVEQGRVELNDWIKGGETIGTVSKNSSKPSGYLYFAVSKDSKFVNPADVVNFD